jgi:hypothetical protein
MADLGLWEGRSNKGIDMTDAVDVMILHWVGLLSPLVSRRP